MTSMNYLLHSFLTKLFITHKKAKMSNLHDTRCECLISIVALYLLLHFQEPRGLHAYQGPSGPARPSNTEPPANGGGHASGAASDPTSKSSRSGEQPLICLSLFEGSALAVGARAGLCFLYSPFVCHHCVAGPPPRHRDTLLAVRSERRLFMFNDLTLGSLRR